MRRYQFRLGPVLRVRRIEEDRAAGALAAAQRDEHDAAGIVAARRAVYDQRTVGRAAPVDATRFASERFLHETAAAAVATAEDHREAARLATAERAASYIAAAARRSALERLDERKREEHRLENDRLEALEVDDLVNARRARAESHR